MKRFIALSVLIAGLSCCEGMHNDGERHEMELDKSDLYFMSSGGEQTVSILNHERWKIAGGYEAAGYVDGNLHYRNYVCPESSDGESADTYDILDGGWYHVRVPDKGNSNEAIITVDPNFPACPRQATIQMQAGDAFTDIIIYQP